MEDPNIAEKYYGKLKALGEETIADFLWQQAETIKQLETDVARLKNKEVEFDYIYVALFNLVNLKSHKDTFGKTDYYQKEQPLCWQAARDVLTGKAGKQSLAQIQADAIDSATDSCKEIWVEFDHPDIEVCTVLDLQRHAQQLREQTAHKGY